MLSLPLIPPQSDIFPTHFRPRPDSPPPRTSPTDHLPHRQPRADPSTHRSHAHNARAPLALLTEAESTIAARKAAIRDFGASWIRPPGVAKTLQAQREEEAEIAEQEELARQEQGLRDLQARQEVEEARLRAHAAVGEVGGVGEEEGDEEERDLDDDIPDADEQGTQEEEEDDEGQDVTFNEDSLVEGSHVVLEGEQQQQYELQEEAELTGAARDEEELGVEHEERNLDDSIPEAGSYQHTDTEEEDSSSEAAEEDSSPAPTGFMRARMQEGTPVAATATSGEPPEHMRGLTGAETLLRSPGNFNLGSSILESSFVGSSPVMQRGRGGAARARARRGRLS